MKVAMITVLAAVMVSAQEVPSRGSNAAMPPPAAVPKREKPLTRGQMAVFLDKALGLQWQ